ncbi:putative PH domain-containing protein [Histoplasma capsulatum var. duboisii H88]|nr:putative PH domain-containing protein [Histoplasma capsulatum var. duboisii H88]
MGSLSGYVIVYVLGGVTFLPLVLSFILLHAHLTFPNLPKRGKPVEDARTDSIQHPTDDQFSLKTGTDVLAEKFQRAHESDVAAGYFAVCREYVPGGVNGKPPERTTPAGEVVATESPSVYQSMYRSIFDRKQAPTIDPTKGNGKNPKKARNVFFVILRHGHLMLYDDAEQIEVRYVISLAHHNVSIYNGGDPIPEGELWIKRNAICLTRKPDSTPDALESRTSTLPFYLFSENLSEKEDFYFAILKNLEKIPDSPESPPTPQHYDVKHIVTLIQRLHSSEEHLQTRWINALMGRLFLAMYKTPDFESFIRRKITKKISRVTKPNFITKISLQNIDAGEGAPLITNPRLRDLTIDGDCCVEADVNYSGNFRLEVAATARIELGTRFKPREVDLVLAVVLKNLKGHGLLRFKPPPSNRLWVSFESMPHMEMSIEPIVSTRQITYGVILRAIESRIREVVAESLVLPFWDDIPFLDTEHETFRGGIWHHPPKRPPKTVIPDEPEAQQEPLDPVSPLVAVPNNTDATMAPPSTPGSASSAIASRRGSKSIPSQLGELDSSVSSGMDRANRLEPPRAIRSRTFSHVADPVVTADTVKVDHSVWDSKLEEKDATATMIEISNRSQPNSPTGTPVGSPPKEASSMHRKQVSPRSSTISDETRPIDITPRTPSTRDSFSPATLSISSSPRSSSFSLKSETNKQNKTSGSQPIVDVPNNKTPERQVIGSIGSAAAAARKWGLNVLKRNGEPSLKGDNKTLMPDHPIGRGHPLPPPGTPLPLPDKFGFLSNPSIPKRKPLPPPLLPERPQKASRPVPKPPLPSRPGSSTKKSQEQMSDELLIIEAPLGSEPTTPITDFSPDDKEKENTNFVESNLPPTEHNTSVSMIAESLGAENSKDSDLKAQEDSMQSTRTMPSKDEAIAKPPSVLTHNEQTDFLLHP